MKAISVLNVMSEIRDLLLLQKEVFTISEVCSYTGFEKSYIYKLTSIRKIPHYKSPGGKNIFFMRVEINEWLTQNRIKTMDEMDIDVKREIKNLKKISINK